MRLALACIAVLFLVIASCASDDSAPKNVIQPQQMRYVVWDLLQADELTLQNKLADTSLDLKKESFRLYDQVFAIHKITREQFYTSYEYYQQHPDVYRTIMQEVKEIAQKQKNDTLLNRPLEKPSIKHDSSGVVTNL